MAKIFHESFRQARCSETDVFLSEARARWERGEKLPVEFIEETLRRALGIVILYVNLCCNGYEVTARLSNRGRYSLFSDEDIVYHGGTLGLDGIRLRRRRSGLGPSGGQWV